jgi:hypothetical protein
MTKMLWKML